MKDASDLKLESLFASAAIADAGFSARVEKRINRQLWVRRLTLPVAVIIGGAIAAKPLFAMMAVLTRLVALLPGDISSNLGSLSSGSLPQLSTVMIGGMLALAFVMISQMLEN